MDAKVVLRTATDKKLTVMIRSIGASEDRVFSDVSIRAGTFGKDSLQQTLLDKIREHLPAPSTQPVATTQPAAGV